MTEISSQEFAAAFLREAVTPERIAAVVRAIAGSAVHVGPIAAGPGGMATATAVGRVSPPIVERLSGQPLRFMVRVPIDVTMDVALSGATHHYTAECEVHFPLTACFVSPLAIRVEPTPPTARDVTARVHAQGMPAKMVAKVGNIDHEVKEQIARYVTERIDADAAAYTTIDLRPLIREGWPSP